MATIEYKPTCSECGAIITEPVYGVRHKEINIHTLNYRLHEGVSPSFCVNCGALFDCISFPSKINVYDEVERGF